MNKTNYQTKENFDFTPTPVIPYLAENAIFVLCKTPEYNRCHIKFKFSDIVCIRTDGENQSTILTSNGARHTALMVMAEILVWLPESKFARISWNTTVNLTLVERIMGNILYIKDTQYFVDKMYAENIQKAFHTIDRKDIKEELPSAYKDSIFVRIGDEYRRIRLNEILWIESCHNYCDIQTLNTSRPYCSDFPLSAWQKILPKEHFLKLYRSLIINVNHADVIKKGKVKIQGHFFDIPKAQRNEVLKYFHLIQRKKSEKSLFRYIASS